MTSTFFLSYKWSAHGNWRLACIKINTTSNKHCNHYYCLHAKGPCDKFRVISDLDQATHRWMMGWLSYSEYPVITGRGAVKSRKHDISLFAPLRDNYLDLVMLTKVSPNMGFIGNKHSFVNASNVHLISQHYDGDTVTMYLDTQIFRLNSFCTSLPTFQYAPTVVHCIVLQSLLSLHCAFKQSNFSSFFVHLSTK